MIQGFLTKTWYLLKGYKIGKNVYFGRNVTIKGKNVFIGDDCYFDDGVTINSPRITIGNNSSFYKNVDIFTISFLDLGARCKISRNCVFKANSIHAGHDLWCNENVEVGGGGWQLPTANLVIGDFAHIGKNAHLNVCKNITIDGYCGIGMDCMLFTHSSGNGQSVLKGYISIEGDIHIGRFVSLYSRVIVAPNTDIQEGVTVAAGSYVKGLLDGCSFYAGAPAKFKSKYTPLSEEEMYQIIQKIIIPNYEIPNGYICKKNDFYIAVVKDLSIEAVSYIRTMSASNIHLCVVCLKDETAPEFVSTYINLSASTISGYSNDETEKLRDELRRKGIILDFNSYVPNKINAESLKKRRIEL